MQRIAERQREGEAVDLEAEVAAIERAGYAFPTELTDRILRVWGVVDAAGWEAARELCAETFAGWEVAALGQGLAMIHEAATAARAERDAGLILRGFGGSSG